MGCNEIARYLSRSGGGRSARVERIALPGPMTPDVRLRVIEGAAHGMFLTHVERVNAELLEFISESGYIGRDRQERG